MSVLKNYLIKTKSYTPVRFIFELTFLALICKFIISLVVGLLAYNYGIEIESIPINEALNLSHSNLFLILCIIAPIFETLVFQWLPINYLNGLFLTIH